MMDTSTIAKINYIRSVDIVAGNTLALQLSLAENGAFTYPELERELSGSNDVMKYMEHSNLQADSLAEAEALVKEIQSDILDLWMPQGMYVVNFRDGISPELRSEEFSNEDEAAGCLIKVQQDGHTDISLAYWEKEDTQWNCMDNYNHAACVAMGLLDSNQEVLK